MVYSYVLEHFLVFKNTSLMDKMWPLQFYKKAWGKKIIASSKQVKKNVPETEDLW